jgi:hypothetical protein
VTGVLGIFWFAVQVAGVVLFVLAGNPPSFDDAKKFADFISSGSGLFLADAFLTGVGSMVLLMVLTGLRRVVREAGPEWEWAAVLAFGAGLVLVAVQVIGAAVEATVALASTSGSDPMTVRTAWLLYSFIFTFIYLPIVVLLGTVSFVVFRAHALPAWTGWLGGICAVLNLAAVFTIFGGTGNNGPNGLLPLILGFAPAAIWVLAVSISLLRAVPVSRREAIPAGRR